MSTGRLDPRERVEQSQLAAALAASRQLEPTPQPLPPPTATKYGDLGSGTLLTTTTETTTTSGSVERKSSDDRSGLLSSLNGDDSVSKSNERGHIEQQTDTTPRMLSSSSTRPSARAPKRTLIDDEADWALPPTAALKNAAAHALGPGSALRTNMAVANDTIMADDTAEVIGDSDEESRRELTVSPGLFRTPRSHQTRLTLLALDPCSVELHPVRRVSASRRRKASRTSEHGDLIDRRSDSFLCRPRSEQTVQGEPHFRPDRHDDDDDFLFFTHHERVEKEQRAGFRPRNRGRSEPT